MRGESGQGLVEYSLILLLIALAVIVILSLYGEDLGAVYSNIIANIP
jgi:Flp pilus assembly pilin Flp